MGSAYEKARGILVALKKINTGALTESLDL